MKLKVLIVAISVLVSACAAPVQMTCTKEAAEKRIADVRAATDSVTGRGMQIDYVGELHNSGKSQQAVERFFDAVVALSHIEVEMNDGKLQEVCSLLDANKQLFDDAIKVVE
jgi:hypothetical protein